MNTLWLDSAIPMRTVETATRLLADGWKVRSIRKSDGDCLTDQQLKASLESSGPGAWLVLLDPALSGNPHRRNAWEALGVSLLILSRDWLDLSLETFSLRLMQRILDLDRLAKSDTPKMLDVPADPTARARTYTGK
ncbi:MAG: hypothetical protein H7A43_08015 [Verrucomicrobia bacterium]|nr:hypothetical protein [Verrucomicrobiota bacterium]